MAYAGRTPTTGFRSIATKDTFSGDGSTTAFTLSLSTRTNDVEVFVENVQQEPTTAYSISGNTLTFTSAPVTGTNNIYVIHRGELVSNGVHTPGADLQAVNATITGDLTVSGTTITMDSASVQTVDLGDNDKIRLGDADDAQIYHDGTNTIINNDTGNIAITGSNVGIGTTSPSLPLTLKTSAANSNAQMMFENDARQMIVGIAGTNADNFNFYDDTSNQTLMTIDTSGNVGIGTSSPSDSATGSLLSVGTLGTTSNTKIQIGSTVDSVGAIYFGDGTGTATYSGYVQYSHANNSLAFGTSSSERMRIDSSGNVGIGTNSPVFGSGSGLEIKRTSAISTLRITSASSMELKSNTDGSSTIETRASNPLIFGTSATERMRIDSGGTVCVGTGQSGSPGQFGSGRDGVSLGQSGFILAQRSSTTNPVLFLNNQTTDTKLVAFYQAAIEEGNISVSGSTVSYNGGHLARWSRLADDSKDTSIVKGTVMTNLDEMVVWSHDAVEAQDAVYETVTIPAEYDEDGNEITPETTEERLVSEAVEAKEAYTEENEQLNKMAVSFVEGDPNVAGVFVNWDADDDKFNDMNIAMTGDMVIRIAQGTTVQRGDLLMSAGDGTAKPQGDDIVRSKTIAKVTSTHVSHTYDDGSYLVPCVLMAC